MAIKEIDVKFKRDGGVLRARHKVDDELLKPKAVLEIIKSLKDAISGAEQQLVQLDAQKNGIDLVIHNNKDRLKLIGKHEEWANTVQVSLAKALSQEVMAECVSKITADYVFDKAMDERSNILQMYAQLQRAVGTHPKVAESLSADIIKEMYFNNCIFDNPFKAEELWPEVVDVEALDEDETE